MGPIHSSRLDRNVTKGKQRVCIAISVGLIAYLGLTEMLQRAIERLQSHLGVTEIPIGKTDLLRICGSGYGFLESVALDRKFRCDRFWLWV